jgi:hypothetical protein
LTKQLPEIEIDVIMKPPLLFTASAMTVFPLLSQCTHKPLLPDYEPLCAHTTPGTRRAQSLLSARNTKVYRVGPRGGIYHVNEHNEKVYLKTPPAQ